MLEFTSPRLGHPQRRSKNVSLVNLYYLAKYPIGERSSSDQRILCVLSGLRILPTGYLSTHN
jgi:hypothetical protein